MLYQHISLVITQYMRLYWLKTYSESQKPLWKGCPWWHSPLTLSAITGDRCKFTRTKSLLKEFSFSSKVISSIKVRKFLQRNSTTVYTYDCVVRMWRCDQLGKGWEVRGLGCSGSRVTGTVNDSINITCWNSQCDVRARFVFTFRKQIKKVSHLSLIISFLNFSAQTIPDQ